MSKIRLLSTTAPVPPHMLISHDPAVLKRIDNEPHLIDVACWQPLWSPQAQAYLDRLAEPGHNPHPRTNPYIKDMTQQNMMSQPAGSHSHLLDMGVPATSEVAPAFARAVGCFFPPGLGRQEVVSTVSRAFFEFNQRHNSPSLSLQGDTFARYGGDDVLHRDMDGEIFMNFSTTSGSVVANRRHPFFRHKNHDITTATTMPEAFRQLPPNCISVWRNIVHSGPAPEPVRPPRSFMQSIIPY